jgi:mono/diheme cytochrome c family protein
MRQLSRGAFVVALAVVALAGISAAHAQSPVERGKYLVSIMGCNDCHTAGYFFGKPDMTKYLAGSDIGFDVPNLGVFVGRNLTPDKATGLGNWTNAQIVTALQTGVRPDGRVLAPSMPWRAYAALTKADANAVAAFLKSMRPMSNAIPGPFGPGEKPTVSVMKLEPPPQ